jgi:uncharacterized protein
MTAYKTALITGASSGIGAVFAEALASAGSDVVLVARSTDKLQALAAQLVERHARQVHVIPLDLAQAGAGATLSAAVAALGLKVDLLINNAGFGTTGPFEEQDAAREAEEVRLNAGAVVELAHAFLPGMLARGRGGIINVASVAAFQPMPYFAVYAATKAFVYAFSDALWAECRGRGVHVMAVCPGPVDTPFFENVGSQHRLRETVPKAAMATPEFVVRCALEGLHARRRLVIPGGLNKTSAALTALLPRSIVTRLIGHYMKG